MPTETKPHNILPWQISAWSTMQAAIQQNRLPHALLMTGAKGIGEQSFATQLARKLLCNNTNSIEACGQCNSCHLFDSETHPDYYIIAPEDEGKAIKVDRIREMIEKNSLTPHISSFKVHLIIDADKMNIAASNSLLKTLEEPTPNTIIVLISSKPELLSATIRSRCQNLAFSIPDEQSSIDWLKHQSVKAEPQLLLSLTQGAPLEALKIDGSEIVQLRDTAFIEFGRVVFGKNDPVKIAAIWQKQDTKIILKWMTIWVIDLIRLKYNKSEPLINNHDQLKGLLKISSAFTEEQLFINYQQQLKASYLVETQVNKLLLLESLLIPWVAV